MSTRSQGNLTEEVARTHEPESPRKGRMQTHSRQKEPREQRQGAGALEQFRGQRRGQRWVNEGRKGYELGQGQEFGAK